MNSLTKKEMTDLLNKCWMTHDGMWFYSCLMEYGIDTANKMNKAAIKSLAPIETKRMKKVLGFEKDKFSDFNEFKEYFIGVSEILIPDFMGGVYNFSDEGIFSLRMKEGQCFAYKGMKNAGVIDQYLCGVIYRIECWFDCLGLNYSTGPPIEKCTMHFEGSCEKSYKFHFE